MKIAPPPPNEESRIKKLYGYEVLDTPAEKDFDDIVRLASYICQSPIALVSLIDRDRQWFKAKLGIDAEETPRDLAFCAHAILKPQELLVVEDTLNDDRFADNPLVSSDPNIRFYAGCPLNTESGESLGTLCVIDKKPKKLTTEQEDALKTLANQVMAQIELRKTMKQMQQSIIEQSIMRQKQESHNKEMGELYSALAHQFKTPLAITNSLIPKVKSLTNISSSIISQLDKAHHSITQVIRLLNALSFTHSTKVEAIQLALHDTVEKVISQLKKDYTFPDNIRVSVAKDILISAQPSCLEFVIEALITNALQALSDLQEQEKKLEISSTIIDGEVILTIHDNGLAVTHDARDTLFESLSTTKINHQRSSIMLSVARKCADKIGGRLEYHGHDKETKLCLCMPCL